MRLTSAALWASCMPYCSCSIRLWNRQAGWRSLWGEGVNSTDSHGATRICPSEISDQPELGPNGLALEIRICPKCQILAPPTSTGCSTHWPALPQPVPSILPLSFPCPCGNIWMLYLSGSGRSAGRMVHIYVPASLSPKVVHPCRPAQDTCAGLQVS